MNVNIVIFGGRLTHDPEVRFLATGKAVASFTVANNHKWKDKNGETKEDACFMSCVAWSGLAESIGKYRKKGQEILVEGSLKQESWEKDGEKKTMLKLTVNKASWPYSKDNDETGAEVDEPKREKNAKKSETKQDMDDEDIPF